jgi:1,4-alpha-glucan branching enzyme
LLKKRTLKTRRVCKVTFTLPQAIEADSAAVVGDFNDWDPSIHEMRQLKNGLHKVTVELEPDRTYEFRYLVDGDKWYNDWQADAYRRNVFGEENSIVLT